MIIPLYKLQAHNVMTNVVLDAGTDARVAKFLKRSLEVIGLAVLDPMEVWNHGRIDSGPLLSTEQAVTRHPSGSFYHHHLGLPGPQTPDSSVVSLSPTGDPTPTVLDFGSAAATNTPQNTPTGAKKFFGKLFRWKDAEPSDFPVSLPIETTFNPPAPSSPAKLNTLMPSIAPDQMLTPFSSKDAVLQPAVLGIQPTIDALSYPPHGRPTAYVWTVTKWLKGSPDGLLGNVKGIFQGDKLLIRGELMGELERQVEVRFEWTRAERGGKKEVQRMGTGGTELTAGLSVGGGSRSAGRRRSMESARSRSPKRPWSSTTNTAVSKTGEGDYEGSTLIGSEGDDEGSTLKEGDGEQSDPEDSEVPWMCTLHVARKHAVPPFSPVSGTPTGSRISQRSEQQPNSNLSGSPTPGPTTVQQQQRALGVQSTQSPTSPSLQSPLPPQQIKLKVATVSPTPHHPKVVSLLKIPFPLPDIEVSSVNVRKRVVTPTGIAHPVDANPSADGNGGKRDTGLVLTADEIKDIVASTAVWLVVREAMGGVGKVKRKGDGWKLRG